RIARERRDHVGRRDLRVALRDRGDLAGRGRLDQELVERGLRRGELRLLLRQRGLRRRELLLGRGQRVRVAGGLRCIALLLGSRDGGLRLRDRLLGGGQRDLRGLESEQTRDRVAFLHGRVVRDDRRDPTGGDRL